MQTSRTNHAVVIGGPVAGLCAARVLSDVFERVTVLDRDVYPDDAKHRKGVPQSGRWGAVERELEADS
jgi:flavin-dependent dehydrogenase